MAHFYKAGQEVFIKNRKGEDKWRITTVAPRGFGFCTIVHVDEERAALKRGTRLAPQEFDTSLLIPA